MLRIHLSEGDLAETRFAFSPLWESIHGLRVLLDPGRYAVHLPWAARAREALSGEELPLLAALVRVRGYVPDFLTPPPTTPLPDIEEEIDALERTPGATVRREVARLCEESRRTTAVLDALQAHPRQGLRRLAEELRRYWRTTLAADWPRLRAVLEADVLYRARTLALHGPSAMFADLHPRVSLRGDEVRVDVPSAAEIRAAGRGILLIPAVFAGPGVTVLADERWHPAIAYPPRGIGALWGARPPEAGEALRLLLGSSRARLLTSLELPRASGEIARTLGLTPGAASQHLAVLRRAGLVEPHRSGRHVFYRLSATGVELLRVLDAR